MESTSKPEAAVLIGRFQPFHNGHAALLAQALDNAPKVIVVLGSSFHARSARNPFTWQERVAMIASTLSDSDRERIEFVPVRDYFDDLVWSSHVRSLVAKFAERVSLVAFFKDASSYYLNLFPTWPMIKVTSPGVFDATAIRRILYEADDAEDRLLPLVPVAVREYLAAWRQQAPFKALVEEHKAIEGYKASWKAAHYTPIFSTVDSVVTSAGHVLLIRRNGFPGKGLWAIPGGFVEPTERLLQAAIRELGEETQLRVSAEQLAREFVEVAVFDHPQRSQRGRTITHAHHFDLETSELPIIEAADDAALAKWVPIDQLPAMEEEFFEDHYHILDHFLKLR
jgi:bifunctional NMN adenylyltransferase/nudix hydrolase